MIYRFTAFNKQNDYQTFGQEKLDHTQLADGREEINGIIIISFKFST
jgi:hypothetical protein